MFYRVITFFLLTTPGLMAAEYQYASFTEITYTTTTGQSGIILSYVTEPGNPISEVSNNRSLFEAKEEAYLKFYKELGLGETKAYDTIRLLNRLGKQGWEVIHVERKDDTIFLNKLPAKREEFLLKKTLP